MQCMAKGLTNSIVSAILNVVKMKIKSCNE